MSADGEWVLVQGRLEAVKKYKILQKCRFSHQLQTSSEEDCDDSNATLMSEKNLVGAPIRTSAYPRSFLSHPKKEDYKLCPVQPHQHHLTIAGSDSSHDFNLSDNQEWPSIGLQRGVASQLNSWSAVLAKPAPIKPILAMKQESVIEEVTSSTEENGHENERKKSKKRKKRDRGGVTSAPEPLTLELAAVLQALELKQSKKVVATGGTAAFPKQRKVTTIDVQGLKRTGNTLDSSAPTKRRGKEREVPKKKRPSSLRKIITKEKEVRKKEHEMSKLASAVNEIVEEEGKEDVVSRQPIAITGTQSSLHSRKFREYCSHVLTEDINECAERLLTDLVYFQDRQYLKDPIKAKAKRRYVCGLKEVMKHLKLKRVKCVIIPPNLDKIQSEGGVTDIVYQILDLCKDYGIPSIFAMTRRRLAVLLKKKFKIGCVGIFSYDGAESHFKKLMELVETATREYKVSTGATANDVMENDVIENDITENDVISESSEDTSDEVDPHKPYHLNVSANEFVPSFHFSFNVNAADFKPI